MNPTALLSTFITLGLVLPSAGKLKMKMILSKILNYSFLDFFTAPVGFRDKIRGLYNKSLDILNKVKF